MLPIEYIQIGIYRYICPVATNGSIPEVKQLFSFDQGTRRNHEINNDDNKNFHSNTYGKLILLYNK